MRYGRTIDLIAQEQTVKICIKYTQISPTNDPRRSKALTKTAAAASPASTERAESAEQLAAGYAESASARPKPQASPAHDAELAERDERHPVARLHVADLLGNLDQAIGGTQAGDEAGAVAGELVDSEPVRRLLQHAAPVLAPAQLAAGKREQRRQTIAARLRPRRAGQAPQHRPGIEQEADQHRHRIARQPQHHAIADLPERHRPP